MLMTSYIFILQLSRAGNWHGHNVSNWQVCTLLELEQHPFPVSGSVQNYTLPSVVTPF